MARSVFVFFAILLLCSNAQGHEADSLKSARGAAIERIWWNNETKIRELRLTPEQRHEMDHLLVNFFSQRSEMIVGKTQGLGELGELLLTGDLGKAESTRDNIVGNTAKGLTLQLDLMISVTKLLEPEQRSAAKKRFPRLFSRVWIKNAPLTREKRNER